MAPMKTDPITDLDATALSAAIHSRSVSCREAMQAYLARIARLNPASNAIVSRVPDEVLLRQADERDADLARDGSRGWLHGVPQAIKDTGHALGLPTSWGSPLLALAVAQQDSIYVARMKAAGCIVIGKTNVPEFAMGSHTYNPVFGTTPNAWDRRVVAGGSSGGACVALAQRLLPLADGSDFMGSLRNPAAWNHVFGLRPSAGRVPGWPKGDVWVTQLSTDGPLGRSVRDVAGLLNVQAGFDARALLGRSARRPRLVRSVRGATPARRPTVRALKNPGPSARPAHPRRPCAARRFRRRPGCRLPLPDGRPGRPANRCASPSRRCRPRRGRG